jgi:membrane protease YdiL (CAAX protease family)
VTLGPFVYVSLQNLHLRGAAEAIPVGNLALVGTVALQVLLAVGVVSFLYRRGWRLSHITLAFERADVWRALVIALATFATNALSRLVLYLLSPAAASDISSIHFTGTVSGWVIALAVVIDPLFEEALFLGYTITALERYGVAVAAVTSVGLRALVHAYQGPLAVVTIAPVGAVFLYFYLRRRSIWPIVLAHAAIDTVGLVVTSRLSPT